MLKIAPTMLPATNTSILPNQVASSSLITVQEEHPRHEWGAAVKTRWKVLKWNILSPLFKLSLIEPPNIRILNNLETHSVTLFN
jgi:hypothetical protein